MSRAGEMFAKKGPPFVLEAVFCAAACGLGVAVAQRDFQFVGPVLLALVGFLVVRFLLRRPFHEAFAFYVAMACFNYYYFYFSLHTGRNPTDVGELGQRATFLEQVRKDIAFLAVLGLGGMQLTSAGLALGRIWERRLDHPLLWGVGFLIAYSVLRACLQVIEGDAVFKALLFLRANSELALIPFVFCTVLVRKLEDIRLVFRGLLWTVPVVSLLGVVEFYLKGSPYVKTFGGIVFHRAVATLQNPNNLGAYLATGLGLFLIAHLNKSLSPWERRLFWLTLPVGLLCLFMTLSRSSILMFFIALTVSLSVMWLRERRREKPDAGLQKRLLLFYGGMVCFSVPLLLKCFAFGDSLLDAKSLYLEDEFLRQARFFALIPTFKTILADPLHVLIGYSHSSAVGWADNAFSNILYRGGLVGFTAHIAIWLLCLACCVQRVLDPKITHPLYAFCFYILVFQLGFGFSAPVNQNFPHNLYFWLVVGTLVWLESEPIRHPPRFNPKRRSLLIGSEHSRDIKAEAEVSGRG